MVSLPDFDLNKRQDIRDIIEGLSAGLLVIATGNNQVFIKNKINGLIFKVWNKKNISANYGLGLCQYRTLSFSSKTEL